MNGQDEHHNMREMSPSDVIRKLQADPFSFRKMSEEVVVEVPRLQASVYRDIVDTAFSLVGPESWTWRDARGREDQPQSFLRSFFNLLRDAIGLPFVIAHHYAAARACVGRGVGLKAAALEDGCLYLRMDPAFDLRSGGSVAHVAGVINALRTLSPFVTVVSSDQLPLVDPDSDFHEVVPEYGLMRNVPNFQALTYTTQIVRWWKSRRDEKQNRPGFIYSRYSVGNYAAPLLRHLLNVPYVCEYNGSAVWISRHWGTGPMRFEWLFQKIEDANLLGADLIVAVSDASRAELVERGYPADRILTNPNGVDVDVYHPDIDSLAVRKSLGIRADETVIGFVGTFGQWHGAEVLAQAFGKLLQDTPEIRPKVRLLLIGNGMTMPDVEDILAKNGGDERTVFCGTVPQNEAPAYLAACDILASPHVPNPDGSRFFGSPTKLFEYMAMGRAIVASQLEQVGELLVDGETALMVPPGDVDALSEKLGVLICSPEMCQKLGIAARAQAEKDHTWQRHTEKILNRLKSLSGAEE